MVIAYWIVAGLLALVFLAAGLSKLVKSEKDLRDSGILPERRSLASERIIGALEVIGAVGLIVPPLTSIAVILAPVAAIALAVLMIIAVVDHVQNKEPYVPAAALSAASIVVAILGFLAWI
ncbi:DoxX family protein [Demequina globuliformis]|uniref:DoxX family protein n=1 Tax=Demequina globuliformis TaxID=676202 RepID=UPI000784EBD8|nr:DoxX family protein [Demequina globuliformis]